MRNPIPAPVRVLGRRKASLPNSKMLLLETARRAFLCNGLQGTTVDEIAKSAGFSTTMIYYYFGGKEGLACAIANLACSELLNDLSIMWEIEKANTPSHVFPHTITSLLHRHLDKESLLGQLCKDPCLDSYPKLTEIINNFSSDVYNSICDIIIEARRSGILDTYLDGDNICHWTPSQIVDKGDLGSFFRMRRTNYAHSEGIARSDSSITNNKNIIEKNSSISIFNNNS